MDADLQFCSDLAGSGEFDEKSNEIAPWSELHAFQEVATGGARWNFYLKTSTAQWDRRTTREVVEPRK